MIHTTKPTGLLGLLAVGLWPMFASTEADTNRYFLSPQAPVSQTKTADDPQSGKESLPGDLRWVRGRVLSWAADSLTLQLEKKSITLDLSLSAQIIHTVKGKPKVISADQLKDEGAGRDKKAKPDGLAAGSLVQVHYFKRDHKSYALVIIEETDPTPKSLPRSGSSYLGVFDKKEWGAIRLSVNGRTRWLYPSRGTTFVDSTGYRLPFQELKAGDTLLITHWLETAGGDLNSTFTLLVIHRLTLR